MYEPQSFWSRSFDRLFAARRSQPSGRQARQRPVGRCRSFERLETRDVLSATFSSALNIGGAAGDGVFDVAVDNAGNSYVTGYFMGTVDFDLSRAHAGNADILSSRGENDAFVAKYAPNDALLWVRRMGGDYVIPGGIVDTGRSITVDAAGNAYVVGEFMAAADFGGATLDAGSARFGFVTRFSANGAFAWTKSLGAAAAGGAEGVDVDAQGNVYVLTRPDPKSYSIVKLTAAGQNVWTKSLATMNSFGGDLAVSSSGNVFIAGDFSQTVDFDPSSKVKNVAVGNQNAAFVVKLDTNGNFGWVTPFSGGKVYAYSLAVDGGGNVLVGGYYSGAVDFNPAAATTKLDAAGGGYAAKLNSSGGLVWAKAFVGGSYVYGIDSDAAGNVYATGNFGSIGGTTGTIDLDPGTAVRSRTTAGDQDIFVVKLTSAGAYSWGETFGGVGLDIGFGVAVDATGYVHLVGYFTDQVDFDPSPTATRTLGAPGARRDGFRLRLRQT